MDTLPSMTQGERKLGPSIASAIEAEIMDRGWPVGEYLGSESNLIERYHVSRSAIREAIRILESHGAASMRLGPGGGLRVTAPTTDAVLDPLRLVLNHAQATQRQLFEARSCVELACVALATERIDEAGIERLRAVLKRENEPVTAGGPVAHSYELHLAIAEEAGNPALYLIVRLLTELMRHGTTPVTPESSAADEIHGAHAAIVAAIVAGDSQLAQHRMRRHLAAAISEHYRPETVE